MKYYSTRDTVRDNGVSSAFAIKQGLAPDGGLYMPESIPSVDPDSIKKLLDMDYCARAQYILSLYLDDYTDEELDRCCREAYSETAFPGGATGLASFKDSPINVLELWHGPTCAFKDMALQIMPRLLSLALKKTNETNTAVILVATSGDTGKAALEGYKDVDGVKIIVFYPVDGVSKIQKLQMATQEGSNVSVCAVKGNFDDAQNGVKKIFSDRSAAEKLLGEKYILSSANSINWGRLVPQIAYYFSGYCDMVNAGKIDFGEMIDVCVPTGNFGNIFAAYLAKAMGLPVRKLICASNSNNILTDFIETGVYDRNRDFYTTMSPSMDILISSNLERLLYCVCGPEQTGEYMSSLKTDGKYTVNAETKAKIEEVFSGLFADEKQTSETIAYYFNENGYLCDTHTAVALKCAYEFYKSIADKKEILADSTASPYKFAANVYRSITGEEAPEGFEALRALNKLTSVEIPAPLAGLEDKKIRFDRVIDADDMLSFVYGELGITL